MLHLGWLVKELSEQHLTVHLPHSFISIVKVLFTLFNYPLSPWSVINLTTAENNFISAHLQALINCKAGV